MTLRLQSKQILKFSVLNENHIKVAPMHKFHNEIAK